MAIGGLTLTGATIGLGSTRFSVPSFPALVVGVGVTDSGHCIPASSWIAGYNTVTGQVDFGNSSGTLATSTCSGDVISANPESYFPQPGDSGQVLFVNNGGSAVSLGLQATMPLDWSIGIALAGSAGTVTLQPLGSATIEGKGPNVPLTLPDANNTVVPLVVSYPPGASSGGTTGYWVGGLSTLTPPSGTVSISATSAGLLGNMAFAQTTVAALPACNSAEKGVLYTVTNAATPTFLGIVSSTGSTVVTAMCNGTNWVAE